MIYEQTSLQKQRDIDRNKTETLFGVLKKLILRKWPWLSDSSWLGYYIVFCIIYCIIILLV